MRFDTPRPTVAELQAEGVLLVEDGNHGEYRPRSDEFVSHGVAFIRAADMDGGRVLFDQAERINEVARARIRKGIGCPGDVLLSHKGTVGKVALASDNAPPYVCSPQTTFWRTLDANRLDRRYLYSYLRSPDFRAQLASRKGETDMADYVSLTAQRQLRVALPGVSIQREIGATVGALDARIDLLRQTNATLESIAQALFKSWFIDFDPVRAKAEGREPLGLDAATAALFPAEFEESIPAGWRMGTLETLCAQGGGLIQTGPFGSQLHASDYEDQGLPVVMPQDLDGRRISTDRVARVSVVHVERLARHKLQPGDVVFSRRGDVGRHAAVTEVEAGWLCGTGCLLVRPGPRWPSPAYVSQALATPEATDWLKRHAVGATMPNLNTGILGALPMLLPSNPVLAAFESVCGALEARITKNRAQALALSELRDTLLPRLISGKLRLPEAQALMESTP